jgi:hypothetical protein
MTEEPPVMFRRPSDSPEPLPSLRANEHIVKLHTEWARLHATPDAPQAPSARLRAKARTVVSRLLGTADHQLLGDVVRAVDAIAVRCDELSERVGNLELTSDDLARSLGQEITRLRASVERSMGTEPETSTPHAR